MPADAGRILLGPGDDAAVIGGTEGPARGLLLSVDAAEEGVHFERGLHPPGAIGRRAVAAAVSDLAAMGGTPAASLVSLVVPEGGAELALAVSRGAGERAAALSAPIVGGNVTRGARLGLHVSVVGRAPAAAPPLLRSGARPGDVLFVSGPLGASSLGLAALRRRAVRTRMAPDPSPSEAEWIRAHLDPEPRLALGAALAGVATAAMDLSDGLALDLHRLSEASGCGAVVHEDQLPTAGSGPSALEAALFGGEDYELLFTGPRERIETAIAAGGPEWRTVARIGAITPRRIGVCLVSGAGPPMPIPKRGWDPFTPSP